MAVARVGAQISIGVLGDVMLGRAVADSLASTRPEDVWSAEVRELAAECDAVICNLECCISARGRRTQRVAGKPFFFRAPPAATGSLRALGVGAVGLANNHALDYEREALTDTLEALGEAGIAVAGAGRDLRAARQGAVITAGDRHLGLVAISDHPREFAAGEQDPGIAHATLRDELPGWLLDEIARLRAECDLVVAFPHWGPNMTTEPAPWQREAARRMQEAGADLVAGHSAHVFHGVGWSPDGPLLFDLGDALDDYAVDGALRNDLGVMAVWRPGGAGVELELVGLALDFCHTRLAEGREADWIGARLERACARLGTGVVRKGVGRFAITPAPEPDR